ncbi:LysE family translocator [Thalassotalea ponticola]|uniref:LysE family translocator n=1 Tax=Thalassotalea ponticola TaxID=1523392 RepID=UPI0025B4377D|nr:LysE family translocator [Thalassotalea ponticola]MDN3651215.1 LysE family translocator [Thalassotalea ponticola]
MDLAVLSLFIPTFFFVSITPGMCMTLALTLGMSVGVRRTMWMMWGELLGVATVAIAAVLGVAALMFKYPLAFNVFKLLGGGYLLFIAYQMWMNKGKMAIPDTLDSNQTLARSGLFSQGFVTAIANPKGWAFMVSLLPPFIHADQPLTPQLTLLVSIILVSEFTCMMLYATGGKSLGLLISKRQNVQLINRISATLMSVVAIWLLIS